MLANYASESSDSDTELSAPVSVRKASIPQNDSRTKGSTPVGHAAAEPSASGAHSLSDPSTIQTTVGPTDRADEDVVMEDSGKDEDEAFVSNSLKFLQDFAASVDTKTDLDPDTETSTTMEEVTMEEVITETTPASLPEVDPTDPTAASTDTAVDTAREGEQTPSPTTLTPEQQQLFDSFMAQIDALPLTLKDQTRPPPSSNPGLSPEFDLQWQQEASVQSIYSRIHQLSLLSSPLIQSQAKELEKALIKFAIRILDWEKNGLRASYFLGEQRSEALDRRKQLTAQNNDGDGSMDEDMENDETSSQNVNNVNGSGTGELPPYSGVVGSMLETMIKVEQEAAPTGWKVIWDPQEDAYRFFHLRTVSDIVLLLIYENVGQGVPYQRPLAPFVNLAAQN